MSIYTEDKDGNIVLIQADKTLNDIAMEGKAILEAQNLPSDCIQDQVNAVASTSKKSKPISSGE